MPPTVLLSAGAAANADDLRELLAAAGFAVRGHSLGSAPGVEFAELPVALLDVSGQVDAAVAQTRRWRSEVGDRFLSIIWVLSGVDAPTAARGLDAGADSVLARPLDPILVAAQVRAATRAGTAAARVASRAAEARILGDQVHRAFAQLDREHATARRIRLAMLGRTLPETEGVRFAVCHRPRGRTGGDFYAAWSIVNAGQNRSGFLVGDVIGPGAAGELLGMFVADAVVTASRAGEGLSPGKLLARANRELIQLSLDDSPLVALLVGVLDAERGTLQVARAGVPAPVYLPAVGDAEAWAVPGPFLGVSETTYPTHTATLRPGDRLLVGSDGTRPDGDPGPGDDSRLREAAARHREPTGQAFVDAVAAELLAHVRHEDDFTLLCVERG